MIKIKTQDSDGVVVIVKSTEIEWHTPNDLFPILGHYIHNNAWDWWNLQGENMHEAPRLIITPELQQAIDVALAKQALKPKHRRQG